jgi:putative transposase
VQALERTRARYRARVYGFVVMPEHVHLLISEPERGTIANVMQSLKIASARRAKQVPGTNHSLEPFWQKRCYDRNEWNRKEFVEKLKYIHRNPVTRKLVERPEDWKWSSYRHYANGEDWCGDRVVEQSNADCGSHNCRLKAIVGHPRGVLSPSSLRMTSV